MKRGLKILLALLCSVIATWCITIPLSFVLPFKFMCGVSALVGMICGSITVGLTFDWIWGD